MYVYSYITLMCERAHVCLVWLQWLWIRNVGFSLRFCCLDPKANINPLITLGFNWKYNFEAVEKRTFKLLHVSITMGQTIYVHTITYVYIDLLHNMCQCVLYWLKYWKLYLSDTTIIAVVRIWRTNESESLLDWLHNFDYTVFGYFHVHDFNKHNQI